MKLFISYRQEDTGGYSTDLFRRLQQAFGRDNVFFDVKSIALGDDWLEAVEEHIQACDVLLLPIGPQWLTVKDKKGRTRLENPRDPLRVEIEAAIRAELRIIPLLIGTSMPEEDQLPGELRRLATCIALDLRHASFDRDVDYLITFLGGGQSDSSGAQEGSSDETSSQPPVAPRHEHVGQQAGTSPFPTGGIPESQFQTPINLTGTWQAATGIIYSCWQQGAALVFESRNAFGMVVFRGQGTLSGNQLHVIYDASYQPPFVVRGEVRAVVSPDGLTVVGQTMDQVTGVQPAQLRRIG